MMAEQVADASDLVPWLIGMPSFQVLRNVSARLGYDLNTAFDRFPQPKIVLIDCEIHALDHLGHAIDGLKHIVQADHLRPLDHLENPDRPGLDL